MVDFFNVTSFTSTSVPQSSGFGPIQNFKTLHYLKLAQNQ